MDHFRNHRIINDGDFRVSLPLMGRGSLKHTKTSKIMTMISLTPRRKKDKAELSTAIVKTRCLERLQAIAESPVWEEMYFAQCEIKAFQVNREGTEGEAMEKIQRICSELQEFFSYFGSLDAYSAEKVVNGIRKITGTGPAEYRDGEYHIDEGSTRIYNAHFTVEIDPTTVEVWQTGKDQKSTVFDTKELT